MDQPVFFTSFSFWLYKLVTVLYKYPSCTANLSGVTSYDQKARYHHRSQHLLSNDRAQPIRFTKVLYSKQGISQTKMEGCTSSSVCCSTNSKHLTTELSSSNSITKIPQLDSRISFAIKLFMSIVPH
jgi:hypothetical protein